MRLIWNRCCLCLKSTTVSVSSLNIWPNICAVSSGPLSFVVNAWHCVEFSANDILKYFSYSPPPPPHPPRKKKKKKSFDISCKLSETIYMECQILFSKKIIIYVSSAELARIGVKVKFYSIQTSVSGQWGFFLSAPWMCRLIWAFVACICN